MAHFARIENDIVNDVIVINNDILLNDKGIENELIGIEFCKSLYGQDTQWVQTSFNSNFRGKFAGIGMTWDGENFQ